METSAIIIEKVQQALRNAAAALQPNTDGPALTDILLQPLPDSGELLVLNDSEAVLARASVAEWNSLPAERFYEAVAPLLRTAIDGLGNALDDFAVLRPFSFVLIDDSGETVEELCLSDDDAIQLEGELLAGLDDDLEAFWDELSQQD